MKQNFNFKTINKTKRREYLVTFDTHIFGPVHQTNIIKLKLHGMTFVIQRKREVCVYFVEKKIKCVIHFNIYKIKTKSRSI